MLLTGMKLWAAALALATAVCGAPSAWTFEASDATTGIIDLGYAKYQGDVNTTLGITRYYGLHYAQPPTGDLRWRAPVPIETNKTLTGGVINATRPGYECVQGVPIWLLDVLPVAGEVGLGAHGAAYGTPTPNEDCLLLDVIVPNKPKSGKLPVVIQIHGGGYTTGNTQLYDGSYFTSYSNGSVIYVQIQYRLGPYGFLGGEEVLADGVANQGLLDQRLAIKWVQNHIAAFGGDPSKVTIWGGSSGGGSVTAQMQLYGGETNPPFRAGIAEYPFWQPFHGSKVLETQYQELLNASGCSTLACLRALSPAALADATQETYAVGYSAHEYAWGDFYYGPYVDGVIIEELPTTAFADGHFSKVPLLTDHDGYEGAIFTNFSLTTVAEAKSDLQTFFQTNDTSFFARLAQEYPLSDFGASYFAANPFTAKWQAEAGVPPNDSVYWDVETIYSDAIIDCPSYFIAEAVANAGKPAWKLIFNAGSQVHASTETFLLDMSQNTPNATLANYMKNYFLNYIVNTNPNNGTSASSTTAMDPYFPEYTTSNSSSGYEILYINMTRIGIQPDPQKSERCQFWAENAAEVPN